MFIISLIGLVVLVGIAYAIFPIPEVLWFGGAVVVFWISDRIWLVPLAFALREREVRGWFFPAERCWIRRATSIMPTIEAPRAF